MPAQQRQRPFPNVADPPGLPESSFLPPGLAPLIFQGFTTLNTQASRPAIGDTECSWLDGFMPIGPSNARTMPGVSQTKIYEDLTIGTVTFDFANLGTNPIMVVFKSDGSIQQVNTSTLVVTQIAPAGTITNPSASSIGMTQWGSQYVLIVANQTNGYFIWDGTNLYKSGTLGPVVVVTAGGSGYTSGATVAFTGGSGTGATGTVTVTNGIVTAVTVTNPGSGYVVGDTVTATISPVGAGSGATATVVIMPFGVSGNAIETYTQRVWIAKQAQITFSAPASPTNFATSSGGGTFTSTDSFLRVGFSALKQSNGFLYLIGDSSINYISGVQTSGSPATTTFTNQNADPEVGTPFGATVDTIGSNIVFANAWGVHVSYGGKTAKISDMLDGVYNSVPNFGGSVLSATKAIVFGTRIWCLLIPIIDPFTGQQANKMLCWNGQKSWWATSQDVGLTYVQHQEIDSVLIPYGSTGNTIYRLFQTPSVGFQKVAQSRLWERPGIMFQKGQSRLWGMVNYYSIESPTLNINIDNENSSEPNTVMANFGELTWFNQNGDEMPWYNASNDEFTWLTSGVGISIIGPQAIAQNGILAGLTISTNAADVAFIQFATDNNQLGYDG